MGAPPLVPSGQSIVDGRWTASPSGQPPASFLQIPAQPTGSHADLPSPYGSYISKEAWREVAPINAQLIHNAYEGLLDAVGVGDLLEVRQLLHKGQWPF